MYFVYTQNSIDLHTATVSMQYLQGRLFITLIYLFVSLPCEVYYIAG